MEKPQESQVHKTRSLLESGLHADISVVAADGQLPAHRGVLVARSRVFAEMLRWNRGAVHIPDMPLDVVRQLLTFVYTGEVPQLQSTTPHPQAPQLLALADRFNLPALKDMCEWHVAALGNSDTSVEELRMLLASGFQTDEEKMST